MPIEFEKHLKRGHPILLATFAFFSLIELIQTAVLVASYNRHDDYPNLSIRDQTRFLLFTSIWTFFLCFFYMIGFMRAAGSFLFSIASHGVWFFFTWLFWLAGTAALTHTLGGGLNCGSIPDFAHCNQLNSAIAFGWINWIIASIGLATIGAVGMRSARNGDGFGGALIV